MIFDLLSSWQHSLFLIFSIVWGVIILFSLYRAFSFFLAARYQTLQYFASNALFNFFEWDLESDLVKVFGNDKGVRRFYKNQRTNFDEIKQLIHPDDIESFSALINSFKNHSAEIGGIEYRVQLPQGIRWMSIQAKIRKKNGRDVINGYFQDVTDFKRDYLEEKIITHQYQTLLEGGDIGFWNWDLPKSEMRVSRSFSRVFADEGHIEKDIYPASFFIDHISEVDRANVHRHLMSIVNGGDGSQESIFRIIRVDGVERWVNCKSVVHLKDQNGHAISLVGMIMDVDESHRAVDKLKFQESEQRELARHLKIKIEEAQSANRLKSMFLANMSHEIRTPLNAIIGITSVLKDGPLTNQQRYYMDVVTHAGDNLLLLINDILDSSKIEAGELSINRQYFDIRSMVNRAMDIISFRFKNKDVVFSFIVDDDIEHYILGDEFRIYQVLINLLGNAGKFTDQGEVSLVIYSQPHPFGKELVFEVSDTGRGIPKDSLSSIFDVFSQVKVQTDKLVEGTGLGLSISKRIISLMDGRVKVSSVLGEGSLFTVTVPYSKGENRSDHPDMESLAFSNLVVCNQNSLENELIDRQLRRDRIKVDFISSVVGGDFAHFDALLIDSSILDDKVELDFLIEHPDSIPKIVVILCTHDLKDEQHILMTIPNVLLIRRPFCRTKLIDRMKGKPEIGSRETSKSTHKGVVLDSVLIVDDSESNVELMRLILLECALKVDVAKNGREAVRYFSNGRYQLILMDIQMPEMDGHQAFRQIRSIEAEQNIEKTPIWALTAFVHDEEVAQIRATGFDHYMAKPIKRKDFLRILEHWKWKHDSI